MYYVRYYFEENKNEYIVIATTRIETIFSDVAIAFNPNDQTKQKLLNKKVINPLTNQAIPIICDDYIDPEFGTGFMKVSAHALNDIEIIKKNNLEIKEKRYSFYHIDLNQLCFVSCSIIFVQTDLVVL